MLSENIKAVGEIFRELFESVQEYFTAYCWCKEVVKLFAFLLSPCNLIGGGELCAWGRGASNYILF
jgi:hypothetical protein